MISELLKNTSFISYAEERYNCEAAVSEASLDFSSQIIGVSWLNTYGLNFTEDISNVLEQNEFDAFLGKLIADRGHSNKIIQLDGSLFATLNVLITDRNNLSSEQMLFIVKPDFLWSIQQKKGDHFGWIRSRLENNHGIVRSQKADYLLYLLLESIIDNYKSALDGQGTSIQKSVGHALKQPNPNTIVQLEKNRKSLLKIKKAATGLRDICSKLEKVDRILIQTKYFSELKEQGHNLMADIDFQLQEIESATNLIFSLQNHRLNEVMKTLTIFSVIFIPLTFVAGVYGMNFMNIPGLQNPNGFYIVMASMGLSALLIAAYFIRKKWF